ncbi:MAG: glycerophosphodiester phosphodiesterase [Clostridia bacterium]|nr:glycerophosphodiester phosphodiesterase [Clostridia bacterium]
MEKFSSYDLQFAIELKGEGVEAETLEMIKEFGLMDRTVFTSFQYAYIKKTKELDPEAKVGWIISEVSEQVIEDLLAIGAEQIVPKADPLTAEQVKRCREAGLDVRGCCVSKLGLMRKLCGLGVDGMTVNFPDRLYEDMNHLGL